MNLLPSAYIERTVHVLVHLIQCWRYIAHQTHEEEWDLKHRVGDEVQPAHKLVIPGRCLEVDKE